MDPSEDDDPPGAQGWRPAQSSPADERIRRAYEDGVAAAQRGEEAAPGCTTTAEGRAFLRGYIAGAQDRTRPADG